MTYTSGDTKTQYSGNGSATAFPTGFGFQLNAHVKAMLTASGVDDTLVEGVDYSLTGAGAEEGTLTYPKAGSARSVLASGERLTIWLDPAIAQPRTFNNSYLDLNEVEAALDMLTMICGALAERLGRAVMYPVSALESEVGEPEKYIADIRASMASAEAAATAANASKSSAQVAKVAAEAAAAEVPENAGIRLAVLEWSQGVQDADIGILQAQAAQAQRTMRVINHALLGGA